MKNLKDIDKKNLVLVHDTNKTYNIEEDEPANSVEIGYYKDSWNRFKKNKSSVVAFIIICIIFLFIIIGPYLKKYDLPNNDPNTARKLQNLPPKIPGLLKGHKKITRDKQFLTHIYNDEKYGKGVIVSGFPKELIENPNHPDYQNVFSLTVIVDAYKYQEYISSIIPEGYYAKLKKKKEEPNSNVDPYDGVRQTLTEKEFNEYLEKNYIVDILKINKSSTEKTKTYDVRLKLFPSTIEQIPEDAAFWFGTTALGKDLFTELWRGARVSLLMALGVIIINSIIGLTIGSVIGYYGGVVDLIFDRFVEILSSIPFLSVITLLTIRFGQQTWVIILAFTATGWIGSYYTGRMQFYRFKNREYVLAARTLNASDARIMFKHIFPNTLGYIITGYALALPTFIFSEASYSFLGIIDYANTTSVGMLLNQGQDAMGNFPHLLLFPAIYIAILMIAFNLFGNGLRDAFNPSLRGAE